MRPSIRFSRVQVGAEMGATPGGAQDITYFRDRVKEGEIPLPETFTPEGLFSEHDLPIEARTACDRLLCVYGESMPASLLVQDDVRYLAQMRVAGVYGIPGEAVEWTDDGALRMEIATLFLSKRAGAIYVAFASDHELGTPSTKVQAGSPVGSVFLDYEARDQQWSPQRFPLTVTADPGTGLRRGAVLVDEVTTLEHATERHHRNNDQEGAYQAVHQLASVLRADRDPALEPERDLVFTLEDTLALLSGHRGERGEELRSELDPVNGLPR